MKVLVTGGAGYIGSVLVPMLLQAGFNVRVLDNFMYRQNSLLDCCWHENFELIRADARDKDILNSSLRGIDYIIPLAALVGAPLCANDSLSAKTVNLDAIKSILELRSKNQKVIFPTTNSGYGVGEKDKYCTEETPLNPISLYGKYKTEAEKIVLDSGYSLSLRLATVFGVSPRMRLDLLVNDFVYRATNDKFLVLFQAHFKRNYIHIRDVARAFIFCLENFERMMEEPYNLGLSGANLSKLELCAEIKSQIPDFYFTEAEVGEDPDKRDYVVSNAKIEKAGFKPEVSLREGIKELIKGYQIVKKNQFSNI